LIVFILYAGYLIITQELKILELKAEVIRIRQQIELYEARNNLLSQVIENLKSDEYVEKIAREELGLIKEGEIPYLAIPPKGQN